MKKFSFVTRPVQAIRLYWFAFVRKHRTTLGFQIGDVGRAETDLRPRGYVSLDGEIWPAEAEQLIPSGNQIRVVGSERTRLLVERLK